MPCFGARFGIGSIVLLPLFSGVLGFVVGTFGAFLYNVLAGASGGIEAGLDGAPPAA